jgi:hypothetical protein
MLHIPDLWLKGWVTDGVVPHRRRGARGVRFTYDDVLETGRLLPELLSVRRANSRAAHEAASSTPTAALGCRRGRSQPPTWPGSETFEPFDDQAVAAAVVRKRVEGCPRV